MPGYPSRSVGSDATTVINGMTMPDAGVDTTPVAKRGTSYGREATPSGGARHT
jgi:hypothetical protein